MTRCMIMYDNVWSVTFCTQNPCWTTFSFTIFITFNASVNSACAQPPPPPRADPRALAFFGPWMENSRGWGLLSCQISRGGDEKREQMPRSPSTTVWNELCHGPDISRYEPVFLRKTEVWRGIGFRTRSVYIEYQDPYFSWIELFPRHGISDIRTRHWNAACQDL